MANPYLLLRSHSIGWQRFSSSHFKEQQSACVTKVDEGVWGHCLPYGAAFFLAIVKSSGLSDLFIWFWAEACEYPKTVILAPKSWYNGWFLEVWFTKEPGMHCLDNWGNGSHVCPPAESKKRKGLIGKSHCAITHACTCLQKYVCTNELPRPPRWAAW